MTTRDEQIADIRQRTSNLRTDRIKDCYHQVISAYNIASYVEFLAEMRKVQDRSPTDFQVVSNSELRDLSNFNDDAYYWDMYSKDLGRSIARGETRYIFEELQKIPQSVTPVDLQNPDFEPIRNAANEMHEIGCSPNVLCVPIDFFLTVNKHQWCEFGGEPGLHLVRIPEGPTLRVFWSTKYTPLNRFVIVDSSRTRWTVKLDPETQERLTVVIGEPGNQPGSVMFLAETVAKFEIMDPNGTYSIPVTGLSHEQTA